MGNPLRIALFSFMASSSAKESRLRVLALTGVVSAIVVVGSIGVVRYSNRGRQITPAIIEAASSMQSIPDSLISRISTAEAFSRRSDEFAGQLVSGALPVDSVRVFYQSYAMWMRDGHWDLSDLSELALFLAVPTTP